MAHQSIVLVQLESEYNIQYVCWIYCQNFS